MKPVARKYALKTLAAGRLVQGKLRFWLRAFGVVLLVLGSAQAQDFLPPEQAFQIETEVQDPECQQACLVQVNIEVEPEYYLYRERFQLTYGADVENAEFVQLPNGKRKFDEFLGEEIEALRGQLSFQIAYTLPQGQEEAKLNLVSQGCADAGLCYPPMQTPINLTEHGLVQGVLGGLGRSLGLGANSQGSAPSLFGERSDVPQSRPNSEALQNQVSLSGSLPSGSKQEATEFALSASSEDESGSLASRLSSQPLYVVLPVFFGLGLLLAFTPCTLPMLPIVTSLVVGQGNQTQSGSSRFRAFSLALVYVFGMALTYAVLGAVAGLSGQSLVVALQQPAVLWSFGALLALLGAALLLGYQIQIPARLQNWLQAKTGQLKGGHYIPVLVMGLLSALLLGPCVAPPLAGAMLYVGQTGNAVVGGLALFVLALGMGLPMVLIAAGAGAALPRAGNWMSVVSGVFGFLLFAVALWIINPVTPASVLFGLWSIWLMSVAAAVSVMLSQGKLNSTLAQTAWKVVGLGAQLLALIYLVGLFSGAPSLLNPLSQFGGGAVKKVSAHDQFEQIDSAQFNALLAQSQGPVMLDFYADWCVACKEFELLTLPDQGVQARLAGIRLVQVDVTDNTPADQALLRQFDLFGPPAILFFQPTGEELKSSRVVGFQNVEKFSRTLDQVRARLGGLP